MLVTYVDRCSACGCSSLRDEAGSRPLPGVVGCGKACRCHAPDSARASIAHNAFRFWLLRRRLAEQGETAVR